MSISFIITTFNIEPYISQCLESLRLCLQPGDQVILVDDGSTDGTEDVIQTFIDQGGFGDGIHWTPVWLGVNTIGGVGIPGNIGLDHVECDTVFFVDGDDYLIPDEFLKARRYYEKNPTDIFFTDYLELDQQSGRTKPPADAWKWKRLEQSIETEAIRLAGLDLIAVPWRKFYRSEFLRQHRIRFPEGDFFFEDNPFHWRVCTLARTIGFSSRIICHHRVNRPGQTMASTGIELSAFFTHFRTIHADIPDERVDLKLQAARWLVNNMSWHLPRLQQSAFFFYATRAAETLKLISDTDWQTLAAEMSSTITWHYADRLRQGATWEVIEAWRADADRAAQSRIDKDIRNLNNRLQKLEGQVAKTLEILRAQRAIDEFSALNELTCR